MADKRKQVIVRMSPQLHDALACWAADDMRSLNGQIEMLLRDGLRRAGRLPKDLPESRRPGRPRKDED